MSGIFASFNIGVSALKTNLRSIEVAGRNLANVNNPNYARQRVITGDFGQLVTPQGPQSMGTTIIRVENLRDPILDRSLLNEISLRSYYQSLENGLQQLQASFGETINRAGDAQFIDENIAIGGGVVEAISSFFNAFEEFSSRPTDPVAKQVLVQRSEILVRTFNLVDQRIENYEKTVNEQIYNEVARANAILKEISELNANIARFETGNPESAPDLRDQRQGKLEDLAKYFDFVTRDVPGSNGQIEVMIRDANGMLQPIVTPGLADPLRIDYVEDPVPAFVFGSSTTQIDFRQGSLVGLKQLVSESIPGLSTQLNTLASELTTQVNGIYSATGNDYFLDTGDPITAGNFALDPTLTPATITATATAISGANEIADALADLANQQIAGLGDLRFSQYGTQIITQLGQDINNTSFQLQTQRVVEQLFRDRRDQISGVSIDEESTDLLKFQRAYQASARFINIVDSLLESVANGFR